MALAACWATGGRPWRVAVAAEAEGPDAAELARCRALFVPGLVGALHGALGICSSDDC